MIRPIAVGVAIVSLAVVAFADEAHWEKFTSNDGRFTISFPSAPKAKELKADGKTIDKNQRFETKRDGVDYDVGYIAYSKAIADKFDAINIEDFTRRQREATVKRTQGTILVQKDVTLGQEKRPGYELLIQFSPKGFLRQRVFYAHGKLYQLMVTGTSRDAVTGVAADKFLDSFQIAE